MSVGSVTPPPGGTPLEAGDDQEGLTFGEAEAMAIANLGPMLVSNLNVFLQDVAKQNK